MVAYIPYQAPDQNWTGAMFSFMAVMVMGAFTIAISRSIAKEMSSTEEVELLPAVRGGYQLARTPPRFQQTKRVLGDRLYVLEKTEFPLTAEGVFRKYYMVVSPRAYRPRYFPHVELLGEYLPTKGDLFILDIHGLFSLDRELPVMGTELKRAMEEKQVFKAFLVTKKTESLPSLPGVIIMPRLPGEARRDFFFVEYIRDLTKLGGSPSPIRKQGCSGRDGRSNKRGQAEMAMLAPVRGGFLRPFGCGWFIREYLLGHGPEGAPTIDPEVGACQEDIFYHYKRALHRAYAEDAVAYENEERIRKGLPIYTPLEYGERVDHYFRRIPYNLVKCRYHSFSRYFHMLKQLDWVELTGKEEAAAIQEYYASAPPRRYYRLTRKGREAADTQWSNPKLTLYPELTLEYHREKRKEHSYSKKAPTKSRRAARRL